MVSKRHSADGRPGEGTQRRWFIFVRMGPKVMGRSRAQEDDRWHLDKRVPIAIILTIAMQTGGVVWWAAGASERLTSLERKVELTAPQGERLARVEVNIESIKDSLNEIKTRIRVR